VLGSAIKTGLDGSFRSHPFLALLISCCHHHAVQCGIVLFQSIADEQKRVLPQRDTGVNGLHTKQWATVTQSSQSTD